MIEEIKHEREQVTLEELSRIFGIKLWTLRAYAHKRKIPIIKIGSRIYVNLNSFREWLKQHEIKPISGGAK